MTSEKIRLKITPEDHRIAKLSAWAIGLAFFESLLPSPLVGVKPGLANIITLIILKKYDLKTAIWVSLLRVFAGSLFFGFFLTPTFFLSLSGAIFSLFILSMSSFILSEKYFGLISFSILGSFAHIFGQLLMVYYFFIPSENIFYFVPIFAISALIFGLINGLIAEYLLKSID